MYLYMCGIIVAQLIIDLVNNEDRNAMESKYNKMRLYLRPVVSD